MAAGGLLLVGLVLAFRPLARTRRRRLRPVEPAGDRRRRRAGRRDRGNLEIATALRLRNEAGLDDLLLIDPDMSSNDSEIVSVYATEERWTAAARADTGACFWMRLEALRDEEPRHGHRLLGRGGVARHRPATWGATTAASSRARRVARLRRRARH